MNYQVKLVIEPTLKKPYTIFPSGQSLGIDEYHEMEEAKIRQRQYERLIFS